MTGLSFVCGCVPRARRRSSHWQEAPDDRSRGSAWATGFPGVLLESRLKRKRDWKWTPGSWRAFMGIGQVIALCRSTAHRSSSKRAGRPPTFRQHRAFEQHRARIHERPCQTLECWVMESPTAGASIIEIPWIGASLSRGNNVECGAKAECFVEQPLPACRSSSRAGEESETARRTTSTAAASVVALNRVTRPTGFGLSQTHHAEHRDGRPRDHSSPSCRRRCRPVCRRPAGRSPARPVLRSMSGGRFTRLAVERDTPDVSRRESFPCGVSIRSSCRSRSEAVLRD